MNTHIIYKLIFPNGKVYIGQTVNYLSRMSDYKNLNNNIGKCVKRAVKYYGWKKVQKEILFTVSEEFVDELETKMIAEYNSLVKNGKGYNILEIGESRKGFKHSEKSKKLISKKLCGKNHPMYRKHHSEETKQLIRDAKLGQTHSKESKEKISKNNAKYWKNKHLSEKTKQLMRKKEGHSVNTYTKIGEVFVKNFDSITQAEQELKIPKSNIWSVLKNRRKSAGGYVWKYAIC